SSAKVNVAETTIPPLGGMGSGFSTHATVQRPSGVSATEAAPPCRQRCLVQSAPTSPNGNGAPKPPDAPPAAPARLSCGRVKLSSDCVQSASIRPSGVIATAGSRVSFWSDSGTAAPNIAPAALRVVTQTEPSDRPSRYTTTARPLGATARRSQTP